MSLAPDTALRRFPSAPAVGARDDGRTITDLTARPRMGVRGGGTLEWCRANGLPFPDDVNWVARQGGLCIARLGIHELLVLSESDAALPSGLAELPAGVYSGYREESWAWFRFAGSETLGALARCTSADLRPTERQPSDRVIQTGFAGLDAVIVLSGEGDGVVADVFADIASHRYLLDVFAERCPEFGLSSAT